MNQAILLSLAGSFLLFACALAIVLELRTRRRALDSRLATAAVTRGDEVQESIVLARIAKSGGLRSLVRMEWPLASPAPIGKARRFILALAATAAVFLLARALDYEARTEIIVTVVAGVLAERMMFLLPLAKARARLLEQMPDMLGLIVRALRSGMPVTEAVRVVGKEIANPTGAEFARIAAATKMGIELEEALWQLAERTELREYRFMVVAVALQVQTGGNLAEALEGLADIVRRRRALKAKAKALTAEVRMTTYILACIPFLGAALLALSNYDQFLRLTTTPDGHFLITLAAILLAMGLGCMRYLIKRMSS